MPQDFGGVLQRQRAGFLFGQAVAAENQAEVVGESELFQEFGGEDFVLLVIDHQRDAQRLSNASPASVSG